MGFMFHMYVRPVGFWLAGRFLCNVFASCLIGVVIIA